MTRGCGDVVAIAGIVAPERTIGALDDPLGALDDAVKRRAQNLIQRVIEDRGPRQSCRRRRALRLHRAPKAGEAALGTRHYLAAENDLTAVVGATAGMLPGETAPCGKRADQRHFATVVFLKADDASQR